MADRAQAATVEVGGETQDLLTKAAEAAAGQPIDAATLIRLADRGVSPVELADPAQKVVLPGGWQVFYTEEDHPQGGGGTRRMRHVSISHETIAKPPRQAVEVICSMLVYQLPLQFLAAKGSVYVERLPGRRKEAVNVIEPTDLTGAPAEPLQ